MATRLSELPQPLREKGEFVQKRMSAAEPVHRVWREKAEKRYAQYRGYQRLKGEYRQTSPPDRDEYWRSQKQTWGTELFIPYSFSTVETIIPRMLANRPRMLVLPRDPESEANIEAIRQVIDAQQEQFRYELVLQEAAKNGLIYGLGPQKVMWRTETRERKRLGPVAQDLAPEADDLERFDIGDDQQAVFLPQMSTEVIYDDPDVIAVDPFDFFWEPSASSMQDCEWVIHRTWRSERYVRKMIKQGTWENITEDEVSQLDSASTRHQGVWESRRESGGESKEVRRDDQIYEVWEFQDGEEMITVLNQQIPVQVGEHPYWHGEISFQIFRPTIVPGEFAGIGEIEPIEELQNEMNQLRSMRRDNAALVLQRPIAYWQGLVDPDVIRAGPGDLIPVPGDPRELLHPLEIPDIPGSGYQEELGIQADIERTTGISDPVTGAEGQSQQATATGVQLLQQAASFRIQNKVRLLEASLIAPGAQQMLYLNQQKIRETRQVRIPNPGGQGADQRWLWRPIGPPQLAGSFTVVSEGGSTQPDNEPQERQDAQLLMQMFGQDPQIIHAELLNEVLRKMSIKIPEAWILPPVPTDPAVMKMTLDLLASQDADAVRNALEQAQAQLAGPEGSGQNGAGPQQQEQVAPIT